MSAVSPETSRVLRLTPEANLLQTKKKGRISGNGAALFKYVEIRNYIPQNPNLSPARQAVDEAKYKFLKSAYTLCAGKRDPNGAPMRVALEPGELAIEFQKLIERLLILRNQIKILPAGELQEKTDGKPKEKSDSMDYILGKFILFAEKNLKNECPGKAILLKFFGEFKQGIAGKNTAQISDDDVRHAIDTLGKNLQTAATPPKASKSSGINFLSIIGFIILCLGLYGCYEANFSGSTGGSLMNTTFVNSSSVLDPD